MNPFSFDWDAQVEPEERDKLLESLAGHIVRRGVGLPAQWILEVNKPLMNIESQFAISFSPLLASLFPGGASDMQKYTKLMSDRANVDRLIELIDGKEREATVAAR